MLFNEPKLLKYLLALVLVVQIARFSALQRAEIAEIPAVALEVVEIRRFSALQRAEIAEMGIVSHPFVATEGGFSALQRAEIAEMQPRPDHRRLAVVVSVLFNEPKLLKSCCWRVSDAAQRVSVLFNEPKLLK